MLPLRKDSPPIRGTKLYTIVRGGGGTKKVRALDWASGISAGFPSEIEKGKADGHRKRGVVMS